MEETSGGATEEGSPSQQRQEIDVMCTDQTNIVNLQYGQSGRIWIQEKQAGTKIQKNSWLTRSLEAQQHRLHTEALTHEEKGLYTHTD